MKKYQRKPLYVNAVKWAKDLKLEGLEVLPIQIVYSLTGDYYTIADSLHQPQHWFSTEMFSEDYVTQNKHQFDFARYERQDKVYYRRIASIQGSLISAGGLTKDISLFDPLYQDFVMAYGRPINRELYAVKYKDSNFAIREGDWILEILGEDNSVKEVAISADAEFKLTFEPTENVAIT